MKEKFLMFEDEDDGCIGAGKDPFGMKITVEWEFTDLINVLYEKYYEQIVKWWKAECEKTHLVQEPAFPEAVQNLFAMKQATLLPSPDELEEFRKRIIDDFGVPYLQKIDRLTVHVMKNTCRNMSETVRRIKFALEIGAEEINMEKGD